RKRSGGSALLVPIVLCNELGNPMIRTMTAFAGADVETPWGALAFELRSVNHRYLELNPRLPEDLRAIEPQLRERVAAKLTRGKVDVNLRFRPNEAGATNIR